MFSQLGDHKNSVQFSCLVVSDSAIPWTAACQASLSITSSRSSLKLMSIESVTPSNHLFLCHPLLLLQSFPASRSFLMSPFFASGGQSVGVSASASVLPMNIQDWFPLGWTGWISLLSKGLTIKSVQYHNMVGRITASKRWPPPNLWNLWTCDLTWQKEHCRCD